MTFDGSEWIYVGEQGFSTWDSQAGYITIATDIDDEIYISFQEEAYGDGSSVMTWDGSEWAYVGEPGFSEGGASFQSLVIDDSGKLFVAYRDQFNENKCSVMTWDGSDWGYVGVAGFSPGSVSYTSLVIDSENRLSVTYRDWANSSRTSVMSFIDGEWIPIGDSGISTSSANHQDIAVNANGHLWVAYEAGDVEVQRFVVLGCNDVFACNYDSTATDDDGSCVTIEIYEIEGVSSPQAGATEVYTYTETTGSSYMWEVLNGIIISGQGTASIEVEWGDVGEGSITVIETNLEECESEPVTLEVTVPVGISEFIHQNLILYPNPAGDKITISWPFAKGDYNARIMDSKGNVVQKFNTIQGTTDIDVSPLASGTYTLRLTSGNLKAASTFIVK